MLGATGKTAFNSSAMTKVSNVQNTLTVGNAQIATGNNMTLQNFSLSTDNVSAETEQKQEAVIDKWTAVKYFFATIWAVIEDFFVMVGTAIKKAFIKIKTFVIEAVRIIKKILDTKVIGAVRLGTILSGIILFLFVLKIIILIHREYKIRKEIENKTAREFIKSFIAYLQLSNIYIDPNLSEREIAEKLKIYLPVVASTETGEYLSGIDNDSSYEQTINKYAGLIKNGVIDTADLHRGIFSWFSSWFTSFTPSFETIEKNFRKYYERADVLGNEFIDYIPFYNKNNSIVLAIDYMIKSGVGKEKIQDVISELTDKNAPDDTDDKKLERKITKNFYNNEKDSIKLEKLKEKLICPGSDKVYTLSDLLDNRFSNAMIQDIHYYENVYDEDKLIVYYKNNDDGANAQNEKIKVAEFTVSSKLTKEQKRRLINLNEDNKSIVGKILTDWIFNNRKTYGIKLMTEYTGLDDAKNETVSIFRVNGDMLELYLQENANSIKIPLANSTQEQIVDLLSQNENNILLCDVIRKLKNILKKEEVIKNVEILKQIPNQPIENIEYYESKSTDENRYNLLVQYKENNNVKKIRLALNKPLNSDKLKELNSIQGKNLFYWIVGNYQYFNIELNWPAWANYEKFNIFKDEEIDNIELKDGKIKIKFKNRIRVKDLKNSAMFEENLNKGVPIEFNRKIYEIEIPVNPNITESDIKNIFSQFKKNVNVPSFYSFLSMCKEFLGLALTDDKHIEKIDNWEQLSNEKVQDIEYYEEKDELVVYCEGKEKGVILPLYKKLTEKQVTYIKNYSKSLNTTVENFGFTTTIDNNKIFYTGVNLKLSNQNQITISFVKNIASDKIENIVLKGDTVYNNLIKLEEHGFVKLSFADWVSLYEQTYGIVLKDKYKELTGIENEIMQQVQTVSNPNNDKKVDKIKVYFKNKTNGYDFVTFKLKQSKDKKSVEEIVSEFDKESKKENNVYKRTIYSFIEFIEENYEEDLELELTKGTEIITKYNELNNIENETISSVEPIMIQGANDENKVNKIRVYLVNDGQQQEQQRYIEISLAESIELNQYNNKINQLDIQNINNKNINFVIEQIKKPLKLVLTEKKQIKKSEQQINNDISDDNIDNNDNDINNIESEDDEINTDSNRNNNKEDNDLDKSFYDNKIQDDSGDELLMNVSDDNGNENVKLIKKLLKKGFKLELLDNGKIKDKDLEDAINAFRKYIESKYGKNSKYSEQTNNQIVLAILMIMGKIGVLEVGEGKSEAFNLAMAYLYKKGDTSLLYTTSSKTLTFRDVMEKVIFLNNPIIKDYVTEGKSDNSKRIEVVYIESGKVSYLWATESGVVYSKADKHKMNPINDSSNLKKYEENLDYEIFTNTKNRIFFAQQDVYSYLKQQADKGEIKGKIPNFTYFADEADYVVNKPTDYTIAKSEQLNSNEKKEILELIQKNIDLFKESVHFRLKDKAFKFYKDVDKTQKVIDELRDKIKATRDYQNNKDKYNAILDSGEFIYMIDSLLNVNYTQKEGEDYIVTSLGDKKVIQIRGQNGEFQSPNIQNEENIHLAIIAYQEIKKGVTGLSWETSKILDKENIFGFLNWNKLKNKCMATGTDSPSLKEVGEVAKLESVNGAKNVEVGLYIEQTEDNKRDKIASVLREFFFGQQNKPRTAFIFEKNPATVQKLREYLTEKKVVEDKDILILDGKNGEVFEDYKDKLAKGKFKIVIATQTLNRGVNLNELKGIDKLGIRAYPSSYSSLIQQEGRFGRGKKADAEALINIYSIEALENLAKSNGLDKYEYISSLQEYLKNETEHKEKSLISESLRKKISKTEEITYADFIKAVTNGTLDTLKGNLLLRKNKSDIEAMLNGLFKMLDRQAVTRAKLGMALAPLQKRRKQVVFDFKLENIRQTLNEIFNKYNRNDLYNDEFLENKLQKAKLKIWEEDIKEQGKYSTRINIEFKNQSKKTLFGFVSGDATSMIAEKLTSGLDELQEKLIDQFLEELNIQITAQEKSDIKKSVAKTTIMGNFLLILTGKLLKILSMPITTFFVFIGILLFVKFVGIGAFVTISPVLVIVALVAIVGIFILKKTVIDRINAEILNKDNINIVKAAQTGNSLDLLSSLGSVFNKLLNSIMSLGLVSGFVALIVGVILQSVMPFTLAIVAIIISLLCGATLYLKNKAVLPKQERIIQDNTLKRVTHMITGLVVGGMIVIVLGLIQNLVISATVAIPIGIVVIAGFLFAQYIIPQQQGDYFAFNWKAIGLVLLGTGLMGGFSVMVLFELAKVTLSVIGGMVIIPMMATMSVMAFLYFYRMQKRVEGENYGIKKIVSSVLTIPLIHSIVSSILLSNILGLKIVLANMLVMLSNPMYLMMFIGFVILGIVLSKMLSNEKNAGLIIFVRTLLGFISGASGRVSPTIDSVQYEYNMIANLVNNNTVLQNFNVSDEVSTDNVSAETEQKQEAVIDKWTAVKYSFEIIWAVIEDFFVTVGTAIKDFFVSVWTALKENKELFEIKISETTTIKVTAIWMLGAGLILLAVIIIGIYKFIKWLKQKNRNEEENGDEEIEFGDDKEGTEIKTVDQFVQLVNLDRKDGFMFSKDINNNRIVVQYGFNKKVYFNRKESVSEEQQEAWKNFDSATSSEIDGKDLVSWMFENKDKYGIDLNIEPKELSTIDDFKSIVGDQELKIQYSKYEEKTNRIILYYIKDNTIKGIILSCDSEKKLSNVFNFNNKENVGQPLNGWIISNKKKYGINIADIDANINIKIGNIVDKYIRDEVTSIEYNNDDYVDKITLNLKTDTGQEKSIEIYLGKKISLRKVNSILNYKQDKKNKIQLNNVLLYDFVTKYNQQLGLITETEKIESILDMKNWFDKKQKIETAVYDNDNKEIIVYYKSNNKTEGVRFSVGKELDINQKKSINNVKNFDELRKWILRNRKKLEIDLRGVTELWFAAPTLKKSDEIECIEYYKENEKNTMIVYPKGEILTGFIFSFDKDLNGDQIEIINKLKDFVELRRWILNNRKSLGINVDKMKETPITTEDELLKIGSKTIEGIECYQDEYENKKIIAYYKDEGEIKGIILSCDGNENLSVEQENLKLFNNKKIFEQSLIDWIINNKQKYGINIKISNIVDKYITDEVTGIEYNYGIVNKIKLNLKEKTDKRQAKSIEIYLEKGISSEMVDLTLTENPYLNMEMDKKNNKKQMQLKNVLLYEFLTKYQQLGLITETKKIESMVDINRFDKKQITHARYNNDNKEIIVYYEDENKKTEGVSFSVGKELDINQKESINNVKNFDELRKWIISNRKKLEIQIQIDEKPITTEDDLSSLGNKTIEGIEYYQDAEKNNKVIVYYKEKKEEDKEEKIKGVVFDIVTNLNASQQQKLENINTDNTKIVGKPMGSWIDDNKFIFQLLQDKELLKSLEKINNVFGNKEKGYKIENIIVTEGTKNAYISVNYNNISFNYYISDKEGKIIEFTEEQANNLKNSIDNISGIKEVNDLAYITDNEGNGKFTFKYGDTNKTIEVKFEGNVLTKELVLENIKKNSIVITNQNNNNVIQNPIQNPIQNQKPILDINNNNNILKQWVKDNYLQTDPKRIITFNINKFEKHNVKGDGHCQIYAWQNALKGMGKEGYKDNFSTKETVVKNTREEMWKKYKAYNEQAYKEKIIDKEYVNERNKIVDNIIKEIVGNKKLKDEEKQRLRLGLESKVNENQTLKKLKEQIKNDVTKNLKKYEHI